MKHALPNKVELPTGKYTHIRVKRLDAAAGLCALCGHSGLRVAHTVKHKQVGEIQVGRVCAGKLIANPMLAEAAERAFRIREKRRARWLDREWKRAPSGISYASGDGAYLVVYPVKDGFSGIINSLLDDFKIIGRKVFPTEREAQRTAISVLFNARPETGAK